MKDGYVQVGKLDALEKLGVLSAKILGKPVAVFTNKSKGIWAIEMSCKHQGADLTTATIKDTTVTCPRHGWIYNIETGACNKSNSPNLREHSVIIENEKIFVSIKPVSPTMPR